MEMRQRRQKTRECDKIDQYTATSYQRDTYTPSKAHARGRSVK